MMILPNVFFESVLDQILVYSRRVSATIEEALGECLLSNLSLPMYIYAEGDTTLLVK